MALAALADVAPTIPALVAFICRSGSTTAGGDEFAGACAEMARHSQVAAVGLNCTAPQFVESLLRSARARCGSDAVLVAYPNSGEVWDASEGARCWHDAEGMKRLDGADAVAMHDWGANVIGGCCRVDAEQIRAFREALLSG